MIDDHEIKRKEGGHSSGTPASELLEGLSTRPDLPIQQIELEIVDLALGLHADAVRIAGGDLARLGSAGEIAHRHGLETWRSDPTHALDASSYAQLRAWPDGPTDRKASYHAVAEAYALDREAARMM